MGTGMLRRACSAQRGYSARFLVSQAEFPPAVGQTLAMNFCTRLASPASGIGSTAWKCASQS